MKASPERQPQLISTRHWFVSEPGAVATGSRNLLRIDGRFYALPSRACANTAGLRSNGAGKRSPGSIASDSTDHHRTSSALPRLLSRSTEWLQLTSLAD